jgi:hypothetical protein
LAGFCGLVDRLQAPEFTKCEAGLPKVSGRHPEYSRFRETGTGDRVRSPLGGAGGSRFGVFSAVAHAPNGATFISVFNRPNRFFDGTKFFTSVEEHK